LELLDLEFNWLVKGADFGTYAVLSPILHGIDNQPISEGK